MKDEFRNEALAAVAHVNGKLGIQSTNRANDKPDDPASVEGMRQLTAAKKAFTDAKSDKKLAPVGKWKTELSSLSQQNQVLLKQVQKVGAELADKNLDQTTRASRAQEQRELMSAKSQILSKMGKLEKDLKDAGNFSDKQIAKINAKAAEAARFGNCEEKSSVAYFYLKNKNVHPIELMVSGPSFTNPQDTHQFVVIGRKKDENVDFPEQWSDAAICDPWDNTVYPPSELLAKLEKFGYLDTLSSSVRNE